jgi:hypothetical protein
MEVSGSSSCVLQLAVFLFLLLFATTSQIHFFIPVGSWYFGTGAFLLARKNFEIEFGMVE